MKNENSGMVNSGRIHYYLEKTRLELQMKVCNIFTLYSSKINQINNIIFYLEFYKAGEFLIFREQSSTFMCRVRSVVNNEMDNNTLKLKVDMLLKHEKLPNCRPS